jgi:glycosyltransferase involved in cell wall biosynthesis
MRIAMVADHPGVNQPNDGGVQSVTSYLVEELSRFKEIDLHVVRLRAGIDRVTEEPGPGFTLHTVPIQRLGTVTGFWKDQSLLNRKLASIRPDVIHSQGGGHYGILTKRAPYPSVITFHGILAEEAKYQQGLAAKARTAIQGWMADRYCVRRGTFTILISPYVAEQYGKELAGKRYLIPNPVHESFFRVVRKETSHRVLFAGKLRALKGVKNLIRAVAMLSGVDGPEVVLAGSTADAEYVGEIKAEAQRLGVLSLLKIKGILSREELLHELSLCSCLVLPSYQETAPMVIQEAMASGVPVIASDVGGIRYQVEEAETGYLVCPGDIEMLTDRLGNLLSSKQTRESFGMAARQKAQREYPGAVVAEKTHQVYRDILQY